MAELVTYCKSEDNLSRTALHRAAINNDFTLIRQLLFLGADVNERDALHQTALHFAAAKNENDRYFWTIDVLLKSGANVNARDRLGDTPLHNLARKSGVKTVKLLLNFKPNVNVKNSMKKTPLLKSIEYKNTNIVQLLVDYGADVNEVDAMNGMTLLHYACRDCYDAKIIKCLLKNGASMEALDNNGNTPRMQLLNIFYNRYTEKKLIFLITYFDVFELGSNVNNILTRHSFDQNSWMIILKHFAKLQALNLPVHNNIFDSISSKNVFSNYFTLCVDELSLAKVTKLKNFRVTYFNLLVDNEKKLKNYARDQDLMIDFHSSGCLNKFPIYGAEMQEKVNKGLRRRDLFERSSIKLSFYLPIFSPNHYIIRDVFDFIKTKDLLKFYCNSF